MSITLEELKKDERTIVTQINFLSGSLTYIRENIKRLEEEAKKCSDSDGEKSPQEPSVSAEPSQDGGQGAKSKRSSKSSTKSSGSGGK